LAAPPQAPNAAAGSDLGAAADPNTGQAADQASGQAAAPNTAVGPTDVTTKLVAKTIAKMGQVVTDDQGFVLYRFDKDTTTPPTSNCVDKCTAVWPPATTADGNVPQIEGVDPALVGTTKRADGTVQITLGNWPMYRYLGDKTPGKWTGQGVGGTWWVSDQRGKKNLTCVPTSTPTAISPDSVDSGTTDGATTGGGGGTY
jgi:predicted lipoprotein with Yx(FWY)xxD motif